MANSLLNEINQQYLTLHTAKEEAFWQAKMGLSSYVDGSFEKAEITLQDFVSDPENLKKVDGALQNNQQNNDLSDTEKVGLTGWQRFFRVRTISSDDAKKMQAELITAESKLGAARRRMNLGYKDPKTGEHTPADSLKLGLMLVTDKDENMRKAAWMGLRSIENYVLDENFIEIVKLRNQLAKSLGYEDYYDYKVTTNEGFSKAKLFSLLDELAGETKTACENSIKDLQAEKGENATEPWNFSFVTAGDLTVSLDPYLRFEDALERWGKSFTALGIKFNGATLKLDLMARKGKYENGFMHGPTPGFVENGTYRPAEINFTANALAGEVGSGKRAIQTLFHEGGHAAHFSNIKMPAPCFAQEYAPTSVAFAETQSMFLDSLITDPDWLVKYAKNAAGERVPDHLIHEWNIQGHRFRAFTLRKMLAVSYAEKALYEMTKDELTPENILATFRKVEVEMLGRESNRPMLSIPHLLSGEASAYYHGYTLALMAVYQTRAFFLARDGFLTDNEKIGPALAEFYWAPGNSKTFLAMIEDLTGEPFSAKSTVKLVNQSVNDVKNQIDAKIKFVQDLPHFKGQIDLDATIEMVHGDETVCSMNDEQNALESVAETYKNWLENLAKA